MVDKHKKDLNRDKQSLPNTPKSSTGDSGARGGARLPTGNVGPKNPTTSVLAEETQSMMREQRLQEQQGHRHFARVNAREHAEKEQSTPEGELQNSILQHPDLDGQRFDGVDPNLNPEPPLNSEARREYDNARREQEMEKQLRLGNMPQMNNAPKPQGP